MLVDYSSSSEEESDATTKTDRNECFSSKCQKDANDGCPAKKKSKIVDGFPKTRCLDCLVLQKSQIGTLDT